MTIEDAVKEARARVARGRIDPLATWILDTFALPLARHMAHDLPDVMGWGLDVVEIDQNMTGSWDADDALGIATVIIARAEDARMCWRCGGDGQVGDPDPTVDATILCEECAGTGALKGARPSL